MAKQKKRRRVNSVRASATQFTLSDEWRAWIVESLLFGTSAADIASVLAGKNVPPGVAEAEIERIAASPAIAGCHSMYERVSQLETALALIHEHRQYAADPKQIDRRPSIDAESFFTHYYAKNTPLVLTDLVRHWPAAHWSPEWLTDEFGHVDVEVSTGRDGDANCDRNFKEHRTTMPLAKFVRQVTDVKGQSNDIYMIANNHNLKRLEFQRLFDDVNLDPVIFDKDRVVGASSFWFGPAGTRTPLHHDVSNILFCQIYGSKRITLIPPTQFSLFADCDGFYAGISADELPDDVFAVTLELKPGEALFIPAGWFHEVTALSVSINISFLNFRRPNNFDWYRPGHKTP